jgi:hypothetical protein
MAESRVPAAILHHPDPEVRHAALAAWETCERCEDFVRAGLAVLGKLRTETSLTDADRREFLQSLRSALHSLISIGSLTGQNVGYEKAALSVLDLEQAALDVTPAGGDSRDLIAPAALETALAKTAEQAQLISPLPLDGVFAEIAEQAQLISPAPEHGQPACPL